MFTNRLLVVVVALLMLSAGCLGGGGGGSDAADGASGGADGGDGAASQSGDGDAGASSGDELELTDAEQTLRDAGSFTASWTYRGVDERGVESEVRHEFYVDLDGERSLTVLSSTRDGQSDGGSMQQFFADGVTYVQSGPADSPTYFSYEQQTSDPLASALGFSQARVYEANDDLSFEGTETYDGVSVERYELSEASSQLIQAGSAVDAGTGSGNVEVTDFHYTVLVDEDGLSRYESWSYEGETDDGETISGEWEYSLTKVGSTTVDDPEWLAEAEAASEA
ncbi:hypothetical protein C2R22_02235 [Salinigranum rubrum]|uniref:Lipoprotein n=1 Tax=Salinigranum rubrum TaxID=755307 RepID=A0A2I8VFE2_9EURY|nr:hypothetical protein [Salinigranum rubrum]AUV80621.1 hypothetical protein C2R22_02235 [Salinigranum rubrum]